MPFGDSKSVYGTLWPSELEKLLITSTGRYWHEPTARIAVSGTTVALRRASIDADLAMRDSPAPDYILIDLGVNDMGTDLWPMPASQAKQDTWVANYQYLIDALHTKYPSARIGLMRVWRRGYTDSNNLVDDTLLPLVIAGRSWAFLGPDCRVVIENGDDGVTYTSDGIHYNAAGQVIIAQAWKVAMGL